MRIGKYHAELRRSGFMEVSNPNQGDGRFWHMKQCFSPLTLKANEPDLPHFYIQNTPAHVIDKP